MATSELIVLIVRDSALRSALIARLSLEGESLVTLDADPEDIVLDRIAPSPRTLVIDNHILNGRLQSLVASDRWGGIIVLAEEAGATQSTDRVRILDQRHALVEVLETLVGWRLQSMD